MPIYEYICCTCGNRFALLQPVGSDERDTTCTTCGGRVRKVISSFACVSSASDSAGAGTSYSGGG